MAGMKNLSCLVVTAVLLLAFACAGCHRTDPDALWKIVHERCVPDQREHNDPAPCVQVELGEGEERGYAVLKDRNGPYQYLLIPTGRIPGIESPGLAAASAPRYFAAAWRARSYVEKGAGHPLPWDALSLAINSEYGRSQEQLHIHIDCLKAEVRMTLHAHLGQIGGQWAPLDVPLAGHRYRAMRLRPDQFEQINPFELLGRSLTTGEDPGRHTLVAAGVNFEDGSPGFVLLDDRAGLWPPDRGHGEDLQGHRCS
ncbi:MAG: CDP-diacylglycerol diphosphatase [Nevskia sp.]|nr:CDP-diacylglycerol diphosphatase [Nevskia sp.]